MKKIILPVITISVIVITCILLLIIIPKDNRLKAEKQVLNKLNTYSIEKSKGFDFTIDQRKNDLLVNSHTIFLRLDNKNDTIGAKLDYKKSLNEDFTGSQYTEVRETSYYNNGKVAIQNDDFKTWNETSINDFIGVNITSFNFDISKLKNIKLETVVNYTVLTFTLDEAEILNYLKINKPIKDLMLEIKVDITTKELVSFEINYKQELTTTRINFTPYDGIVNIELPK